MKIKSKLVVAAAALALVVTLMVGVETKAAFIHQLDTAVISFVTSFHSPTVNPIVVHLTGVGNTAVAATLAVLLALFFAFKRKYYVVAYVAANMIVINLLNHIIKTLVARPRPFVQDPSITPLVHAGGWSFPSGHSAGAMLLYGTVLICVLHLVHNRGLRAVLACVCVLLIVTIGISRIFVQVHFPTDVFAGWSLGLFGLMVNWVMLRKGLARDGL